MFVCAEDLRILEVRGPILRREVSNTPDWKKMDDNKQDKAEVLKVL
jgi:hypothetical protein